MSEDTPSNVELQRQLMSLERTVVTLNATVIDLRLLVAKMGEQVNLTKCPNPGACVSLSEEVKELRDLCLSLKAESDQRRGERTVIAVICTVIGSVLGLVIQYFSNR